jgi:DNA-binding transcriptional LysR family regulator
MGHVNVAAIDLNLLAVLDALLAERHVTRAARRLGTSQPAVSRALSRLRRIFDDELLVRSGGSMRPTAKAEALAGPLRRVLADVETLVAPDSFEPGRASGTVRLALPDIITYMLGPPLLRRLEKEAPNLDLEIVPWSAAWREQLKSGEADLTFGQTGRGDRGIFTKLLVRNEWATILRKGHPALKRPWSLETYCDLRHLMIGFTSQGGGHVDVALDALGKRRRVALRMPYVVLSPLMVADSDLVLTTARWLAEKLAEPVGLVIRKPPHELGLTPVDLPMVWHERSHRDPKQRWLRSVLVELAREARMVRPVSQSMRMFPR